jgi:hypothetical protein
MEAHNSSVRLVKLAMELQSELDAQEDHDRWITQHYLRLELEALPKLRQSITSALECGGTDVATSRCPQLEPATQEALGDFGEELHAHSVKMIQAMRRHSARSRRRSAELAQNILQQTHADRERQLLRGGAAGGWSDEDLVGPLEALSRTLRRPNVTFELSPAEMQQWHDVASELREREEQETGAIQGRMSLELRQQVLTLVQKAPLVQDDRSRNELYAAASGTSAAAVHPLFVALLARARLHRHLPELLSALDGWRRGSLPVWDVVDMVESLRAQESLPVSMLRLTEESWGAIVTDASERGDTRETHSFPADQ